jgi:hypothetical protein
VNTSETLLNEAATEALANAMYRYSFGIVGNGKTGSEGQGLGTGIGIYWKNTHLILTAAHTMHTTPYERLFFLLPDDSVRFEGSSVASQPGPFTARSRVALENPHALLSEDEDLAVFILSNQVHEKGQRHFYHLNPSCSTPIGAKQFGFLGYPGSTSLAIDKNFMATPYVSFGTQAVMPAGYDPRTRISITYPASASVDPHGLSGGGLWLPIDGPDTVLWTPGIVLAGLITNWEPGAEALIAYKVETLIDFLNSINEWMSSK